MKKYLLIAIAAANTLSAVTSPMDRKVEEESSEPVINCEYALEEKFNDGETDVTLPAGQFSYRVYLPKGYSKRASKKYHCLFILTPGENLSPGPSEAFARDKEMILIMMPETESELPISYRIANFLAAHDDAVVRFRIKDESKVLTGFSDAARIAGLCISLRPGFRGIVLQNAGLARNGKSEYNVEVFKNNPNLVLYGIFGALDPALNESEALDAQLPEHTRRQFATFAGGNISADEESFADAMDWVLKQPVRRAGKKRNELAARFGVKRSAAEPASIAAEEKKPAEKEPVVTGEPDVPAKETPPHEPQNVIVMNQYRPNRTWKALSGAEIHAAALSAADGVVVLRRADKSGNVRIEEAQLSDDDRKYLDKLRKMQ